VLRWFAFAFTCQPCLLTGRRFGSTLWRVAGTYAFPLTTDAWVLLIPLLLLRATCFSITLVCVGSACANSAALFLLASSLQHIFLRITDTAITFSYRHSHGVSYLPAAAALAAYWLFGVALWRQPGETIAFAGVSPLNVMPLRHCVLGLGLFVLGHAVLPGSIPSCLIQTDHLLYIT